MTIGRVIRSAIVEERDVAIAELVPHPKNWRTHPRAQVEALRQVLDRVGWLQRVIVNRVTGHMLDGHLRVELAAQLGERTIPVEYVEVAEEEEALVLATMDPIAGMAGLAADTLADLLREVDAQGELQALLGDLAAQAAARQVRDADPLWLTEQKRMQAKWGTERGQVWTIAERHQLLIADAGEQGVQTWAREHFEPEAVIADPEYDDDAAAVAELMAAYADRAAVLTAGRQVYGLCSGVAGWRVHLDLVWRRRAPRSAPTRFRPVGYHVWILLMARPPAKLGWRRPRGNFGSVVEVEREYELEFFGHAKGAALFVEMMAGFQWGRWVDPYVGSGTSILAADHLSKRCLGIEQSPGIAGLCLQRLEAAGLRVSGPAPAGLPGTGATPTGSRRARRPKVVARFSGPSPA